MLQQLLILSPHERIILSQDGTRLQILPVQVMQQEQVFQCQRIEYFMLNGIVA